MTPFLYPTLQPDDLILCADGVERTVGELRVARAAKPPDPYAAGIAALRAASSTPSTPESRFEERYRAERRDEFKRTEIAMNIDKHTGPSVFPRLTAAELAEYKPPDPYAADLKALREKALRAKEQR